VISCRLKYIQFLLPIALIFLPSTVSAFELAIQVGNHYGGDNSIENLKDVYDVSHPLPAGAGISYSLGMDYKLSEDSYLRGLISKITSNIKGRELNSNARFELEWSHIPIDVLYYRKSSDFIYGGGLSLHLNPEATGKGFLNDKSVSYKTALGLLAEVDMLFTEKFYLGLKYTVINYKSNTHGTISGNSLGIVTGYSFSI